MRLWPRKTKTNRKRRRKSLRSSKPKLKQRKRMLRRNCASSCDACHLRDPKVRCARDRLGIKEDPVYAPGDMEAMFSSIEKTYGTRYGVNVLSRDPWVVTFDNF